MVRKQILYSVAGILPVLMIASGCRHKYDNPITKDTQQPDKVLFDTSIDDIEHGRFERARLTLQTMMNTYDNSEYLAKAKLAMADSWKREGGAHGMAQAEADYKDFILFYPNMEEAAEAQYKVCDMQYEQMDKPDRDQMHAKMAEAECKTVLEKWPNSKFADDSGKKLREIQEVRAEGEMKVADFYAKKGGNAYSSSVNRYMGIANQYPLYSRADDALWAAADDYNQLGDKFDNQQADAYTRIVRDYPLSSHVEDAKAQLKAMGRSIPTADPVAEARMKFEQENRPKRGLLSKAVGPFSSRPNTMNAAKSGSPQMEGFKPSMPPLVPPTAQGQATTSDVTIGPVSNQDILDRAPDARANAAGTADSTTAAGATDSTAPKAADSATGTAATNAGATDPASPNAVSAKTVKKGKAPKQQTVKKRAKPSDRKGTAPTTPGTQPTTTPTVGGTPPTSSNAGGGGGNQVPRQ